MSSSLPSSLRQVLAGLRVLLVLTVVLGLAYPLAITGVAQLAFPSAANGSRLVSGGHRVGSALIGQAFPGPQWFHPRPSAAGQGYDATASGGSNLGPTNPVLLRQVQALRAAVARDNGVSPTQVPPDAVTASGSGLDPHISPAYADLQVARVAKARGLAPAAVRRLVAAATQGRTLGFLGEPRVDVVTLNLALARLRP